MFTPLPFVCGGYCTDTVKLEVENAAQWRAILSSTVSCRSRRLTRQRVTLLLCLYLRCKDAALPTRLRTSHAVTVSHDFMARSQEPDGVVFLFIYSLFVSIFGIFVRIIVQHILYMVSHMIRNKVAFSENGYPFKRICRTDRVWSPVETFCKNRPWHRHSMLLEGRSIGSSPAKMSPPASSSED